MAVTGKKMANFCILEVLKEYSDEDNFLTASDIIRHVYKNWGIELERKSVSATIDALIDYGYDITKTPKGCYLGEREFHPTEISFLVDALFSSKSIDSSGAQKLSEKLSKCLSQHKRRKYKYIHKADQMVRTNNKQLFYNIEILSEAIAKHCQVEFNYNRYYVDQEKRIKKSTRKYIINPYFLINNQGRYYLVCNYHWYNDIANYKVDLITNIKLREDKPAKPITDLNGCQNGVDIVEYANKNIYMFNNKVVEATLKLNNDYACEYVSDWFGKNARFYTQNGEIFADVKANETALVYWCLQYGEMVELISPAGTREKIKEHVQQLIKKYN